MSSFKQSLLMLIALLPLAGRGAVYIEPRISMLYAPKPADIGDIGVTFEEDSAVAAPGLAVGWSFNPRTALELRYVHVNEFTAWKRSPYPTIYPPVGPVPLVVSDYSLSQESNLVSVALPLTVMRGEKVSLVITPMATYEDTHTLVHRLGGPTVLIVPNAPPLVDRRDRGVRPAIETSFEYQLGPQLRLNLHYGYAALANYDAHFFGSGLAVQF